MAMQDAEINSGQAGRALEQNVRFQRILGVNFLIGTAQQAINQVTRNAGLVVAPAAPALRNLPHDESYREALLGADFAIADSTLMVLFWNFLQHDRIPKLSGLKYLRALLRQPGFRQPGAVFWVMPTASSARRNREWLLSNGLPVQDEDFYLAPIYNTKIDDAFLLAILRKRQPRHIVVALGGGTQERLGLYLKRHLAYAPAIHCIGAAIGFLTGDQVSIPVWADHCGLGWLWRSCSDPRRFVPRYWEARHLLPLLLRYRERLPVHPH